MTDPDYAILVTLLACSLAAVTTIACRSRLKKSRPDNSPLVGSRAVVDKQLSPEGSVIVHGQLWNARAFSGQFVPSQADVTVVDLQGHMLVVDIRSSPVTHSLGS